MSSMMPNAIQQNVAPQPATVAPAPAAPTEDTALLEEPETGGVNLHRAYSRLNEALMKLADSKVPRSATIPHIEGQGMDEHITTVGRALSQVGGLTQNLITTGHSTHGSAVTVAHPADKLRETIIPKDDPDAIAAISACKSFVAEMESLIGETSEVKTANAQLQIVGKQNGAGMNVADLFIALQNIPAPVIKAVARAHSGTKENGHAPHLRAPQNV